MHPKSLLCQLEQNGAGSTTKCSFLSFYLCSQPLVLHAPELRNQAKENLICVFEEPRVLWKVLKVG